MQSVPITTDVVSLNPDQGEVYNIMWYSSTNKTDHLNITEKILKMALNTITPLFFLAQKLVIRRFGLDRLRISIIFSLRYVLLTFQVPFQHEAYIHVWCHVYGQISKGASRLLVLNLLFIYFYYFCVLKVSSMTDFR